MQSSAVPDLNAMGRPLSMSYPIDPHSIHSFRPGQTVGEVVRALYRVIYAPESHGNRVWLLSSEFECILTYLLCFYMIRKKRGLGEIWFVRKKETSSGCYYVVNAVLMLSIGVSSYLVFWDITAIFVSAWSFANLSSMEWWWMIPLPWLPLIMGAYASLHGYILGCSPRSPLSPSHHSQEIRKRWIYLPMPRKPAIVNSILIAPIACFTIATIIMTALAGRTLFRAKALASTLLPDDIISQVHQLSKSAKPFHGEHLDASDELIWAARRVSAAYLDCHRYVCNHLAMYAAFAYAMWIPFLLYGIPNLINLVDHACSRHPKPLPASCNGFARKLIWLVKDGRLRSSDTSHAHLATWKMTILAVAYFAIMVITIPAFGMVPIYIIASSFPSQVARSDVTTSIQVATIAISIITILDCTCMVVFCTVASLDPLFRAAIGLGVLRSSGPIDIHVSHRHAEYYDQSSGLQLPSSEKHDTSLPHLRSTSTLKSATGEPDSRAEKEPRMSVDDIESVRHITIVPRISPASDLSTPEKPAS